MASLPTGTVTFLFTDIEGSTTLLQRLGDRRYAEVLEEHRRLLGAAFAEVHGQEVATQGDAFLVAFSRARDALAAAVAAQRALARHPWPDDASLRVRMGLHTGEPVSEPGRYVGLDVHRAARICAAGHGGQILVSRAVEVLANPDLPSGASLRDLGTYRLKDLEESEQLFQVVHPDLPADFPPLNAVDARATNLPLQLTSFIGRDDEIAEVMRLLPTSRLMTLTGFAGVGKTRLALRVAADMVPRYPHGVWVAELGALSDPALVPKAVTMAVDVPEQPSRGLLETLRAYLRSKTILLVLDNCEHLVSACAELADALLRSCPNLQILATSREPLGLSGEAIWRVPPLSNPTSTFPMSVEEVMKYDAVRLFVDRAALSHPGFRVTNGNVVAVAKVAHRLEGIPLAIELAASRVKALPVEVIAAKLDDRFRLLTHGGRTGLRHQQTLHATLDWSYDLLSKPERILLRRLSVFAGGFTVETAEDVCTPGDVDVLNRLTSLVDKSLVVFDEATSLARYRLLETVRQYGAEKLQGAGEPDEVRRRHRDWYLALAEQADRELWGPRQASWLERLDTEHDNLRAALELSKVETDGAEAGLRLSGALQRYWFLRGHWSEARGWLEGALERSNENVPPFAITKALRGATQLAFRQGDYARAITLGEKGVALCRDFNDRENGAALLTHLANVATYQGHYERATALFEESLNLCKGLEKQAINAIALAEMGNLLRHQRDHDRAAAVHLQSLELARATGDKSIIAALLNYLGMDRLLQGDSSRAAEYCRESLSISRDMGHKLWVTAESLEGLAGSAFGLQHYENAACLYAAAEVVREALGLRASPVDQTYHERCLASARAVLGEVTFGKAWAEGRAMTLEQAIEYALAENTD